MTLEIIFDVLKKAQLSDVEVKLSFDQMGKAQVMLSFGKDGATSKDTETVRQLRSALALPLVLVGESSNIDNLVIEGCGHLCEPVTQAVELLSAESLAKKVTKKATASKAQKTTSSSTKKAETQKANKEGKTTQPDTVNTSVSKPQVDSKTTPDTGMESPSLDIFSSGFTL